jgi:transcriptional regulator with XRE-family HTH domain
MKSEIVEKLRVRVLSLVEQEYTSDADFERELGLKDKTVSNWRRGLSASFVKLAPEVAEAFGLTLSELMDIAPSRDAYDLSDDEVHLLTLFRKTSALQKEQRKALLDSIESLTILYLKSHEAPKRIRRIKGEEE